MLRNLTLAAALLWAGAASFGTTRVWDGDTDTNYFNGANWAGGVAPTSSLTADIADFTAGPFAFQPSITYTAAPAVGDQQINGFVTGATPITFTSTFVSGAPGNSLQFGSSGITTGSALFTANFVNTSRFEVGADQTWNIGSGGMDMNAVSGTSFLRFVSNSFTLNKAGTGTLDVRDLSLAIGPTGKFQFSAGVVAIRHQDQLGTNNAGPTGDKFTFDGGTLRIVPTVVNEGNLNNANNGIVVNAGGGTIEFNPFSTEAATFSQPLSGSGTLNLKAGTSLNFVGMSADNSAFTGMLVLTGNNSFHNDFTADSAGANALAPNGRVHMDGGTAPNGTVITFNTSSTYNVGSLSSTGQARLRRSAGNPTVVINQSTDGALSGTISDGTGTFDLVKQGSGNLTLAGNSQTTWTQAGSSAAINAGRLTVAANGALGGTNVTVSIANGAALANNVSGLSIFNTVTTAGTSAAIDPTGLFGIPAIDASAGMLAVLSGAHGDLIDQTAIGGFTKPTSSGGMHFFFSHMLTGTIYNLIDFRSAPGILPSDLVVTNPGWILDSTFGTGAFAASGWNLTGTDVLQVRFSQVPEPASMALLALGTLPLWRRTRRWRSRL